MIAEHPCFDQLQVLAPQLVSLKEKAGISDINADLIASLVKAKLEDPAATVRVDEGAGDIEARARFFKGALYLQFLELRSRNFLNSPRQPQAPTA